MSTLDNTLNDIKGAIGAVLFLIGLGFVLGIPLWILSKIFCKKQPEFLVCLVWGIGITLAFSALLLLLSIIDINWPWGFIAILGFFYVVTAIFFISKYQAPVEAPVEYQTSVTLVEYAPVFPQARVEPTWDELRARIEQVGK